MGRGTPPRWEGTPLLTPHPLGAFGASFLALAMISPPLFSKRQRITLRLLYAIDRPSLVCLSVCLSSVTLVHPSQAVELFGNFLTIR